MELITNWKIAVEKTKDHFYMSRTGSIFMLSKYDGCWYLVGNTLHSDSRILWPVGASTTFKNVHNYIKNKLGFFELK